jgi:hypothetical protein
MTPREIQGVTGIVLLPRRRRFLSRRSGIKLKLC